MEDNNDFILKDINSLTELLTSDILNIDYLKIPINEFGEVIYKLASFLYKEENVSLHYDLETKDKKTGILDFIDNIRSFEEIEEMEEKENLEILNNFLYLTIKFDKVLLKNSEGREHLMTDLFVRFRFLYSSDYEHYTLRDISAIRMSATIKEIASGFSFSHIPANPGRWGSFCLGGGDFGNTVNLLYSSDLIDSWKLKDVFSALYLLEGYVSWESLKGGPYRRMSSVYVNNSNTITEYLKESSNRQNNYFINLFLKNDILRKSFTKYKVLGRYNVRGIIIEFATKLNDVEFFNEFYSTYTEGQILLKNSEGEDENSISSFISALFSLDMESKIQYLYSYGILGTYDLSSFNVILDGKSEQTNHTIPETTLKFKDKELRFKLIKEGDDDLESTNKYSLNLMLIYSVIRELIREDRIDEIKNNLNK